MSVNIHGSLLSDDTVQAEASSSCVFPALGEQAAPSNCGPKQALLPKLLSSHQGKHYPNYFSSEAYLMAGASSMVHSGCLCMTESWESLLILLNGYQDAKPRIRGSTEVRYQCWVSRGMPASVGWIFHGGNTVLVVWDCRSLKNA